MPSCWSRRPPTTSEPSCSCAGCSSARRLRTSWPKSSNGPLSGLATSPMWSPTRAVNMTKRCSSSSTLRRSTSTTTSALNLAGSAPSRTPLYNRHVALGGRMVDFGGWELPQQYTSIRDEHFAVRRCAGLFDISHMGRFKLHGDGSLDFLQGLLTNDLSRIGPGRAQYNLMCNERGGILDDLVAYWGEDGFILVVNASNRERDLEWMRDHAPAGVEIEDRTFEQSLLAFQGPSAASLMPASGLDDLPYFGFRPGKVAGTSALVSRTGYTGEDGFEIFVRAERVVEVWDAILEHSAK